MSCPAGRAEGHWSWRRTERDVGSTVPLEVALPSPHRTGRAGWSSGGERKEGA